MSLWSAPCLPYYLSGCTVISYVISPCPRTVCLFSSLSGCAVIYYVISPCLSGHLPVHQPYLLVWFPPAQLSQLSQQGETRRRDGFMWPWRGWANSFLSVKVLELALYRRTWTPVRDGNINRDTIQRHWQVQESSYLGIISTLHDNLADNQTPSNVN